jgi:hypothetical protein
MAPDKVRSNENGKKLGLYERLPKMPVDLILNKLDALSNKT